jgi:hypothetical protein
MEGITRNRLNMARANSFMGAKGGAFISGRVRCACRNSFCRLPLVDDSGLGELQEGNLGLP